MWRDRKQSVFVLCVCWVSKMEDWENKSWEGQNVLSKSKDKWRPPLQSLYNTPVTSFSLFVTCAAVRGVARCLFVLLTVWGLLNGLSYQCLTFVLVFDPQKCILLLFCGPLYRAAGRVIRCAAQILSKKKKALDCEIGNRDVQSVFVRKWWWTSLMLTHARWIMS